MTLLNPLDILIIVSTIVIACVWLYLVIILHRVAHMTRVADRVAQVVEKFQDAFAILEKVPTEMIRKVTDHLPHKKK